jgi:4-amino-4-deoxy-L-arabinose transferase-like glycosyltransferase
MIRKTFEKWGNLGGDWIERYYGWIFWAVLAVAAFNYFWNLGAGEVWDWDEARAGVTAFEMIQNHNYLVSTYLGQTDLYNSKPPLGLWFIILGYKIFGFNVWGLRFYSALACLISVGMVMIMTRLYAGKAEALLSGMVLTTSLPFVFVHGARSGDYSSLLVCFCVFFVFFLLRSEENPRWLYGNAVLFALAFLLYGFASVQLPVLAFLYLGLTGVDKRLSPGLTLGLAACALTPILLWLFLRARGADGILFLKQMFFYDVVQRSTTVIEGHPGYADYYLTFMAVHNPFWTGYLLIVLFSYLSVVPFRAGWGNRWVAASLLAVLTPLLIFSAAVSKLAWYINPVYPFLAMLTGWLTLKVLRESRCQFPAKFAILLLMVIALGRSERELQRTNTVEIPYSAAQAVLDEFKKTAYPAGSTLFHDSDWGQADQFVAEVECGLSPAGAPSSLEGVLGKPGYLMLSLRKDTRAEDFLSAHSLPVVAQNRDYVIVALPPSAKG